MFQRMNTLGATTAAVFGSSSPQPSNPCEPSLPCSTLDCTRPLPTGLKLVRHCRKLLTQYESDIRVLEAGGAINRLPKRQSNQLASMKRHVVKINMALAREERKVALGTENYSHVMAQPAPSRPSVKGSVGEHPCNG